jgi:FtsZ-binding cell division protein ZapB
MSDLSDDELTIAVLRNEVAALRAANEALEKRTNPDFTVYEWEGWRLLIDAHRQSYRDLAQRVLAQRAELNAATDAVLATIAELHGTITGRDALVEQVQILAKQNLGFVANDNLMTAARRAAEEDARDARSLLEPLQIEIDELRELVTFQATGIRNLTEHNRKLVQQNQGLMQQISLYRARLALADPSTVNAKRPLLADEHGPIYFADLDPVALRDHILRRQIPAPPDRRCQKTAPEGRQCVLPAGHKTDKCRFLLVGNRE